MGVVFFGAWNEVETDWHDRMPQVGMALLVSYRFCGRPSDKKRMQTTALGL